MLVFYNIFQSIFLIITFPFLLFYILTKEKYRKNIPGRLGYGLKDICAHLQHTKKTVWIHALSVGEVTSAFELLKALRRRHPEINIVFSASTSTGYAFAKNKFSSHCNAVIHSPLDIYFVVAYFLRCIRPDVFILVETDYWPNFLYLLEKKGCATILVNGHISKTSLKKYAKYMFFFSPMFQSFHEICVQSAIDRDRFLYLSCREHAINIFGNLKFAQAQKQSDTEYRSIFEHCSDPVIIAGSTHEGEEEILLSAYRSLKTAWNITLVIAPRHINRSEEICNLAAEYGLTSQRHSANKPCTSAIYLLDTLGELQSFYQYGDLCFVGGSLVERGGHNPLEPAIHGKAILFGPDMSSFQEIAADLLAIGGAFQVNDKEELEKVLTMLLTDRQLADKSGRAAYAYCKDKAGILEKHISCIEKYI